MKTIVRTGLMMSCPTCFESKEVAVLARLVETAGIFPAYKWSGGRSALNVHGCATTA